MKKNNFLKIINKYQKYLKRHKNLVYLSSKVILPTKYGEFTLFCFVNNLTKEHHLALVKGKIGKQKNVLCRIHSECLTGDIFSSLRCDCGDQLESALKLIAQNNLGILLYMRQEGRGIGLVNKLKAYELQEQGIDTLDANLMLGFKGDEREYFVAAEILKFLSVDSIQLMTNNPDKLAQLAQFGIKVTKRIPIQIASCKYNEKYLLTKKQRMNHILKKVTKNEN